MPMVKKGHPWEGGYAIPDYVRAESPGKGVHATKYLARRTISPMSPRAPSWRSGYALPDHVQHERPGQNPFRTKYTPRKTVDTLVPEVLEGVLDDVPNWAKIAGAAVGAYAIWRIIR